MSRAGERRRLLALTAELAFADAARGMGIQAEIETLEVALAKMSAAKRGKTHSPEARAKMSAAKRGKTHSPEARAKMSAARKRAWADPEARAKMSAARRGKTHSPEARAKMSAAQKRAWAEKNPDLAGLTAAQREVYRTLCRHGYGHPAALHEAAKVNPPLSEATE